MSRSRRSPKRSASVPAIDPDPYVLALLVKVVGDAIGGLIKKSAGALFGRSARQEALRAELKHHLEALVELVGRAERLVGSDRRMEMGGVLLLSQEQFREFGGLRESIFNALRAVDDISSQLPVQDLEASPSARKRLRRSISPTFVELSKMVKQTLRKASTASTAGSLFAQVRVAVEVMRQMIEQSERAR
jgi:hypothetical protein